MCRTPGRQDARTMSGGVLAEPSGLPRLVRGGHRRAMARPGAISSPRAGDLEVMDGCCLALGRRGRRPYGLAEPALVLVSWRPGVLSNRCPMQLHWRGGVAGPCPGAFQPSANAVDNSVSKSLKRGLITPRQTVNWLFTPFPYCGIILDVLLSPVLIKQAQGNETNYS